MNKIAAVFIIVRFSPAIILFLNAIEPITFLVKYGYSNFSLGENIIAIIILIITQILFIIFYRVVEISEDFITILKFKSVDCLVWENVSEI